MSKPRRIDGYDALKKVFHGNLQYAMEHAPKGVNTSQSAIGKKLGLRRSTVNLWATEKSMPTLDQCYALCAYLGRDIQWMLTSHAFKDESKTAVQTYSDCFGKIRPLVDHGMIDAGGIKDYFLKHMVTRYTEIAALNAVDEDRKTDWLRKMIDAFDVPIMPALKHPLFYTYLAEVNGQITEDETAEQVLKVVKEMLEQDGPNHLERKFFQWIEQVHPTEYESLQIMETVGENPNFFDEDEE